MRLIRFGWLLARKDLRLFFRDRTALLLAVLLPVVLVLLFGFIMSAAFGGEGAMGRSDLYVVDEDGSGTSEALVEALGEAETIELIVGDEGEPLTAEAGKRLIKDGEAHHVLVIAAGFEEALQAGRLPELRLLRDPGRGMEDRMVRVGLFQALMIATEGELWPAMLADAMTEAGMAEGEVETIVGFMNGMRGSIEAFLGEQEEAGVGEEDALASTPFASGSFLDLVPVRNVDLAPPDRPKEATYMLAHTVAGFAVMMLMFGLAAAGRTLIEERDQGTLNRLIIASAPRDSVLAGKFLSTFLMGVLQIAIIFAVGELVFAVNMFQHPLTLAVIVVVLCLAVTSFGMLVGTLAKTTKQADGVSTLIILAMSAMGGAWFPLHIFTMPAAVDIASKCTLTYWGIAGIESMLFHDHTLLDRSIWLPILVQIGFAIAGGAVAWVFYRKRYLAG